ncbi:MAG: DUF4317 domain-containing protein [Oscillospiraceae bacterium]|jgi:hypothetical protein
MNEKETAELRRRFKPDKSNISHVRGCYVNENREIISQFDQSLGLMSEDDSTMILSTLRKTLSGGIGKNLTDISFATRQVVDSDEHRLLMALRDSALADEEAVQRFFRKTIDAMDVEGNYLILLAGDAYDVPFRSSDGEKQEDAGSETFSYILCSICPVKMTKPALSYRANENRFGHLPIDWVVSAPEAGFLFPAFNDRSTDLYGALYYSRDTAANHQAFVDAIFRVEPPMPADAQKETFRSILADSLSDDCSLEVVQGVHGKLREMIEVHKESKEAEPLVISQRVVKRVLADCGVSGEHAETFEARYAAEFGDGRELNPQNLVDLRRTEIRTPDVTIQVSPEREDLVQARVIDGVRYLLIRADEGVEVNGVQIQIS